MQLQTKQSCIRTIKKGDPKFIINDGFVTAPRAGFEISSGCSDEYKEIILYCITRGFLLPVANVKDTELFWDSFSQ